MKPFLIDDQGVGVPRRAGDRTRWRGLRGCAQSLVLAELLEHNDDRPILLVARDARRAQVLEQEIRFFLDTAPHESRAGAAVPVQADGQDAVVPFPDWECLPYDLFSPHKDIISQRLRALYHLPSLRRGIVIINPTTLLQRLPPRSYVEAHSFFLRRGERIDLGELRARLSQGAYQSVSEVVSPGEFAVRGGIIDVFPMGSSEPFRIELFDDEVDTIRYFDPQTQRTTESAQSISLLPAREFALSESAIRFFRQSFRRKFEGDPQKQIIYRDVSKGFMPAGVEFFLPLFHEELATLFDYLPDDMLVVHDGHMSDILRHYWADIVDRYEGARIDPERRVLPPEALYITPDEIEAQRKTHPLVVLADDIESFKPQSSDVDFGTTLPRDIRVDPRHEHPYAELTDFLKSVPGRCFVCAETPGRREMLDGVLREHGISAPQFESWHSFVASDAPLGLGYSEVERGMVIGDPALMLLSETHLYGERVKQVRRRSRSAQDPEAVIRSLTDLQIGAPVVHDVHGVGRYMGLQTLDIEGHPVEFLTLSYLNDDKLYVPVMSLQLVSRYVGGDAEHAPLHKLGTDTWEKAKRKAREKAYDVAAELLEVQALRESRPGFTYDIDADAYFGFAAAFPFEETPDQAAAIEDVMADMKSASPMDRLVCGDVGFGKTEVALRAAYMAVMNAKQVAVLVPTTLLAQQHFDNFQDRFADHAVSIELLSRFRTKKEQQTTIDRLSSGKPDIIIGTHRLLQKDIKFSKLGLVIIDEEHRFGVRQKERLKRLRTEVDILTLTATPIPRTLNQTMAGMRSISVIATPPPDRLSIRTSVCNWDNSIVREACMREIKRGGQVYFLHNEVRTIEKMAQELGEIIPDGRIEIAHGQMSEHQLEHVMSDFYHQRFNVLLCTTIIESGIDIPSANTIIINRADRFGLAQLHQLRGRVGRSHHQAFAYLMVQDRKAITDDARKRLEAIQSLEDLGAGFSLASHDLEIRGAGEILGEQQSGMIDQVGFSLFAEYLNRAVQALKRGDVPAELQTTAEDAGFAEINLHIPALLPETFVPDVHTRLTLYKRIASAANEAELHELQVEIIDRFGLLPREGKTLFLLTALRQKAEKIGLKKVDIGAKGGTLVFHEQPKLDPIALIRLIESDASRYSMAGATTLRVRADLHDEDERIAQIDALLVRLIDDNVSEAGHGEGGVH